MVGEGAFFGLLGYMQWIFRDKDMFLKQETCEFYLVFKLTSLLVIATLFLSSIITIRLYNF